MRADVKDLEDIEAANAAFLVEVQKVDLHFGCGSCAHVVPSEGSCSMGYPNHHLTREDVAIQPDGNVAFCKHWELGETRWQLGPASAAGDTP